MKTTQLLSVLAGAVLLVVALPAYAATGDYTNYWAFDDATGNSVSDTGGQNGAIMGSSTGLGWASGKAGTALAMDGGTGEGVALSDGFLKGSQGTLSVWFKMDALADQNILFSGKSTSDNNVYALLSIDHEGRPQFQFRTSADTNDRKVQGAKILNKNEWYHFVFTANALTYKMFINGEEVMMAGDNIGRWFPEITNQTLSYRIGTSLANPLLGSWSGMLDEVRLYDRALGADEVLALYNEGNAGKPTVPLAIRPTLSFMTSNETVPFGGSVLLTWNATKVDTCATGGSWSNTVGISGTQVIPKIGSDATFTLSCVGKGGQIGSSVAVRVGTSSVSTISSTGVGTLVVTDVMISPINPHKMTNAAIAESFTRNLQVGIRGEEVKALQLILIEQGFLGAELSTGYFGQMTKSAVIKFQAKHGLPNTGFFGPMTRGVINTLDKDNR